jgi:hypothetical protein
MMMPGRVRYPATWSYGLIAPSNKELQCLLGLNPEPMQVGQNAIQPLLTAGRQLRKVCPMRNVRPHHVPGGRVHPKGVAGVEGLL